MKCNSGNDITAYIFFRGRWEVNIVSSICFQYNYFTVVIDRNIYIRSLSLVNAMKGDQPGDLSIHDPVYDAGLPLLDVQSRLLLSAPWNVEKRRSSNIRITPVAGYIEKQKKRDLKSTAYEAYATILFSHLFSRYNEMFSRNDFTLYVPQAVRVAHGERAEDNSLKSVLYELFCPGRPFNRINNARSSDSCNVDGEEVRVGERAMYLSGIFAEIMRREGLVHGDTSLRHFFMLPLDVKLNDVDRDGNLYTLDSRNGLGVIDVEGSRREGPDSEGVRKEVDAFHTRVSGRFRTPRSEEYFERGSALVKAKCLDFSAIDLVARLADEIFASRFGNLGVARVDMREQKAYLR